MYNPHTTQHAPEPAATPPADPAPDRDTPDTVPDILGRALLGWRGAPVLVQTEPGQDSWGSGFVRPIPRAEAVERFAAREVLLVTPAAARVIEAAQEWHRSNAGVPAHVLIEEELELAAAVDALADTASPTTMRTRTSSKPV